MTILEKLVDILSAFIPDKSEKFGVWVGKAILFGSFIILSFLLIRNSPIGEKWGINTPKVVVSFPNHVEYVQANRFAYKTLSQFKSENPSITKSLLIGLYQKRTNSFVFDKPNDNRDLLLWAWGSPNRNINPVFLELGLNQVRDSLLNGDWEKTHTSCYFGSIPLQLIENLRKQDPTDKSNYFVICPMSDRTDKAKVAFTMSTIEAKDYLELNMMGIDYKQQLITTDISQRLSRFIISSPAVSDN